MTNYTKLFPTENITLKIIDNTQNQGLFSFFSKKITVISICPYQTNFYILLSDYSLSYYMTDTESKKIELKDLDKYLPFDLQILYYRFDLFKKDYLLVLCEKNILVINPTNFIKEYIFNLTEKPNLMQINVIKDLYLLQLISDFQITILNIIPSKKNDNPFNFKKYYEFFPKEKIISNDVIVYNNLCGYQTEKSFVFFIFNTSSSTRCSNIIFDKKQSFGNKENIIENNELSLLRSDLNSFNTKYDNEKFSNLDLYKIYKMDYAPNCNYFLFAFYNRVFIIHSFYNKNAQDFISNYNAPMDNTKLKIKDRLVKPGLILLLKIIEPYYFISYDGKIYIYLVTDYNKCIDTLNLDPSFDIVFYKPIPLLLNLCLLNFSDDYIYYNDEILITEILKKKKSSLSYFTRPMLAAFYSKTNSIVSISFENFEQHLSKLKNINVEHASKLLSIYNNTNDMINNKIFNNSSHYKEIIQKNNVFFTFKILELFYGEINKKNYKKSITIYQDNPNINIILIIVLIKDEIKSENLQKLIIFYLFYYIKKLGIDYGQFYQLFKENANQVDVTQYISSFMDIIIKKRNSISKYVTQKETKAFNFNEFIDKIINLNMDVDSYKNFIKNLDKNKEINERLVGFCILENIIFILNYLLYKNNNDDKKYILNIEELLRNWVNLLDPFIPELLKEINLNNQVILYYYYKGNYNKCISYLTSFYEISPDDNDSNESNDSKEPDIFNEKKVISDINNQKETKSYWFNVYFHLLSKILSKLSGLEFDSFIKWALEKNSHVTIDKLIQYKIINDKKINEPFINILKPYGIDPIIYYFGKFSSLEGSENESNEIINLYILKIKYINEEKSSEEFKQETVEARHNFCHFLITNKNYNISYAYDKIINEISFCEKEIGILLIKQENYELGLNKILKNENDNEKYTIELLYDVVENISNFDFINILLKKIQNFDFKEYNQENVVLEILNRIKEESNVLIKLLEGNLLDDYDSEKLCEFFVDNMAIIEGKKENNKIESSLMSHQILSEQNILYDKQSENVLLNYKTICDYCKKCIYDNPNKPKMGKFNRNNEILKANIDYKNEIGVMGFCGRIYHLQCFDNLGKKK